jgi:cytochrome c5
MASTHRNGRKLGWLLACFLTAGVTGMACDDDNSADSGHDADHSATHDAEHSDTHDATAGSGGEHDHNAMVGPLTGATCPTDNKPTYDNFGKKFMDDYCLRCHSSSKTGAARTGAPADHNFDSILDIQLLAAHIDQMAGSGPDATNTKMPPTDPKPSMEERQKLSQWMACGAE